MTSQLVLAVLNLSEVEGDLDKVFNVAAAVLAILAIFAAIKKNIAIMGALLACMFLALFVKWLSNNPGSLDKLFEAVSRIFGG